MADQIKTPGQLAYEAYCETTEWKSAVTGAPLPQWDQVKPEIVKAWENAAVATRRPVAIKVFEARKSLARLLVTYRDYLQGDWYERSTVDGGMKLDGIGFIEGPYKHDPIEWPASQRELDRICKGEA